jgi:uncharacterized protein (DUF2336 family)
MKLSQLDVDRLLKDPVIEVRQKVLLKIAGQYSGWSDEAFSPEENQVVEVLFRTIAKAPEAALRRVLAESVKDVSHLPQDIALILARDSLEVSAPILQYSKVLKDVHLLEIIKNTKNKEILLVISKRENLSEAVTTVLLNKKDDVLTYAVLSGFGSKVSAANYAKILDNPKVSEKIITAIIEKNSIPLTIVEKLLSRVTGKVREALEKKYHIVFENKQMLTELEKHRELAAVEMEKLRVSHKDMKNKT